MSLEEFSYDAEGRLFEQKLTLLNRAAYPFDTNYLYDSLDRLKDITYPHQYGVAGNPRKVVAHAFDAASRLAAVTIDGTSHASGITYNASSQTEMLQIGAAGVNQTTERYDYDPQTGLLAGQRVSRGSDTPANRLLDLTYSYLRPGTTSGRTGHLTALSDERDHSQDRAFEYDPLGRLRRASAGGAQGSWAQRYLYDRYGNRSHVLSQRTSQWVINLFNVTLNRAPNSGEVQTWDNVLRNAYPQGQAQFLQAAKDVAAGFFGSPEYLNRNRANQDYVRDLYLAYLNREPAASEVQTWTDALNGGATRAAVRDGFANSGEFANRVSGMYPGAVGGGAASAPTNLAVTTVSASQLTLNWSAPAAGAISHYRIERKASAAGAFALVATAATTSFSDTTVTGDTAYLYRVTAVYTDNSTSPESNPALGTAITFTDSPLVSGATTIKAAHLSELRRAVNAVRQLAGLGAGVWTDAEPAGAVIRATHVRELRERLDEALAALGLPAAQYTDAVLTAGVTQVRAAHVEELRQRASRVSGAAVGSGTTPGAAVPMDGHAYLSFDAATNRINSAGWEYDAAGNQTRALSPFGAWQRYEYDAANRLVRVKADDNQTVWASYTYGASNERLISDEGGARTYYASEGGQVLAEYVEYGAQTTPQWTKSYIYLGGRLLSTFTPGAGGESVQHHHPDRLGTRLVTDPANGTSFEQASLPFGNALPSESSGATNRRFTSYDRSSATGLDYAVNRRYDPMQGRFTQADPIGIEASTLTDPQTLNLYAYCGNDPVNHVDPDGLFFKKLFRALKKLFTSKWFIIAATVALAVLTIGASLFPSTLGFTAANAVLLPTGHLITDAAIFGSHITAAGWAAVGLGTALALPAITSIEGLLSNAASYGLGRASAYLQSRIPSVGPGGTADLNPSAGGYGFGFQGSANRRSSFRTCFNSYRFSSNFRGTARTVAEAVEVGSEISLAGDLVATGYKMSARSAYIGGTKNRYASGLNYVFRRAADAVGNSTLKGTLTKIGSKVTPALAVTGAFTGGYNLSVAAQCGLGLIN